MSTPAAVIARYTILEAMRNRLVWLVFGFIVAGVLFAGFIGEVAITESRQFQSGFLAALLRSCAVFTVALFVITSMVREFDDKGLDLVLSLPMPRSSYFLGKLAGFSTLAACTALLCALALLIHVPLAQAALWGVSLSLELFIITALSLLCLFTFHQVTWALSAVMAFYVLSRAMSAMQLMAHGPLAIKGSMSQQVIGALVDGLAFVLPGLDRFTRSEWVVYHTGEWGDLLPIAAQSAIYLALLAGAALFDLYRKNL